jgi:hypothetical protein
MADHLDLSPYRLDLALDKRGVRSEVATNLGKNRQRHLEEQRRIAQFPYVQKIRTLAVQCGHTPTQGELLQIGIYHVTLHRYFGSVPEAMRASGLEPNITGKPPMPLPTTFGEEFEPTCDDAELNERVRTLRKFGITDVPAGNLAPERTQHTSVAFYRDPAVAAWVLDAAQGVCEACKKPGYETDDGTLFLEAHHVLPLAEGGPDVVSNIVAVCETCHGKLHRWSERHALRASLYASIPRLAAPH